MVLEVCRGNFLQKLIVKGVLPGLNEMTSANRTNRYQGGKQKKDATNLVVWSCRASKLKPIDGLSDYSFVWYCKDKRRDKDNIMAGQKFIFDGLQSAGIIKNDGWKEIGNISHKFLLDRDNPRVEVEIWRRDE